MSRFFHRHFPFKAIGHGFSLILNWPFHFSLLEFLYCVKNPIIHPILFRTASSRIKPADCKAVCSLPPRYPPCEASNSTFYSRINCSVKLGRQLMKFNLDSFCSFRQCNSLSIHLKHSWNVFNPHDNAIDRLKLAPCKLASQIKFWSSCTTPPN